MILDNETGSVNGQNEKAVEDLRHKNWWWADNAMIDEAGAVVGATAIAVYSVLARHADNDSRACWPSHATIAAKLKISKPTVIAALNALRDCKIIEIVARRVGDDGPQLSNSYRLLPQSKWHLQQGQKSLPRSQKTQQGSKPRGKESLPEQDTLEKDTVKKTQQQPREKIESETLDVVVSQKSVSSVKRHTPEFQQLAERLTRLRVLPDRAPYLIERFGERVVAALNWWESNPDYLASRHSPGAAVAASIETPEKYPQIYAAPKPAESPKPRRQPVSKAHRREAHSAAYNAVWDALKAPLRESLEREGKDKYEYIETHCADALAAHIRQLKTDAADRTANAASD